jgi:alpha-aminoadipate carrier protein LysW
MAECTVCGADVQPPDGVIQGELMQCPDCGVELEVTSVDPFEVQEAPQEEEDWGQ